MIYFVLNNSIRYGGGVEQVVRNLLANFKSISSKEIVLVCNDQNESNGVFYVDGYKCINLRVKPSNVIGKTFFVQKLKYSYKIYRYLSENLNKDDHVIIQGIEYAVFLSLFRKKININFDFIIHLHGTPFEEVTEYLVQNLPLKYLPVRTFFYFFRWYYYCLVQMSLLNPDRLIFVTQYLKDRVHSNKPSVVLHNGTNLESETPPYKLKQESIFRAVIIGSTYLRKGLDVAINAVTQAHEAGVAIELKIIGFSDLGNYLDTKSLPAYISYLGRLAPSEIKAAYVNSDFLLLPSRSESFALVLLEAIQNGLTFVVSDVCKAVFEVNGLNHLGIVLHGYEIKEWVEAIGKMTSMPEYNQYREKIFTNARPMLRDYNWSLIAENYEDFVLNPK